MKTEHEKLLAGQSYDYRDPELQQLIARGRKYLAVINDGQGAAREAAIQEFFGQTGARLTINGRFSAVYGVHIRLGDDVFINGNCTFQDSNQIVLGDRVIMAPDVKLYCGNHALDARQRFGVRLDGSRYLITTTKPITIGNDVWIGGNVTIIGGVHIGNNVVVGAGAVVVKDVPDNAVVAGVPAHVIKTLPPLA
ncbi:maltose acetyltransferase domain-containing protein [Levilactobacillus tujiorum]|uniref:Sugar O-acetyltransferase n=1 Tax=Levilactobacillus tujiorum TaxID=2912243 RepID=A0ABX1L442_9LACO|nr:maltose acetyltransferase domain-containing protein [Levilactobacillus tujiorum]MCH5465497.1 sugar O-acetyltransferase [Levilactobacillus tujiorum]NLR12583.1 sugar O-acetyltransferase [Lactobacillus sp. HBUAS51387]NLR29786.1 sugar O-acetyltransferase [Levilactobacillus tujiorum]